MLMMIFLLCFQAWKYLNYLYRSYVFLEIQMQIYKFILHFINQISNFVRDLEILEN